MPTFYGVPSDGSGVPEQLATELGVDLRTRGTALRDALDNATQRHRHKLGPLLAGYATRTTRPVGVVFVGSSTTEGAGASTADTRWVNRVISKMQAAYPSGTGTESTVVTSLNTPNTTAGVHGYNGGIGGTRSNTYLTDSSVALIGAIGPAAVVHQIGSNDMANNMPTATYKANLDGWLDKLDAAIGTPYVNVLVHSQPRGGAFLHSWDEYLDVLEELAAERDNVLVIDAAQFYSAALVPDPDPFDLLSTDNVHMPDAGHDLMHRVVCEALLVPWFQQAAGGGTSSAPVPAVLSTRSTDSARGVNEANAVGRVWDNELGGSKPVTLVSTSGPQPVTIVDGVYTAPKAGDSISGTYGIGVLVPILDYELSVEIVALPASDNIYIEVRRGEVSGNVSRDVRLVVNGTGGGEIGYRRNDAGLAVGATIPAGTIKLGDRVGVLAKGDKYAWTLNGVRSPWYTLHADLVNEPGGAVIIGTMSSRGWQVRRPAISAVLV